MNPNTKKGSMMPLLLLINSLVLVPLYFFAANLGFPIYIIYLVAGVALGLFYVIYNRGFVGKGLTPDMLGGDRTLEEKQAFLDDCARRASSSRWVLTLLFPIILSFACDLLILFVLPIFEGILS